MSKHIFDSELIHAKFIKRYKRFFVDAELENGDVITAHCANTGSMKGLMDDGAYVYVNFVDDPKRKLKYSLQMMDVGSSLVGVNTSLPNVLVDEAIRNQEIPSLTGYALQKREVKYGIEGKSRIDVYLEDEKKGKCYVEVKNVTLKEGTSAAFPDAVTTRGAKHLDELINEVENGNRAVMFYLVQRSDCEDFKAAESIDPTYTAKLKEAVKTGVEVICYSCTLSPTEIKLDKPLPINI